MEDLWLMHGEVRVARISMDSMGTIRSIGEIVAEDHMPPGTLQDSSGILSGLNRWWSRRAIPSSRWIDSRTFNRIGVRTPESLMVRTMGVGLSDSYWISPPGHPVDWADVNFYRNEFSKGIGVLLFDPDFDN